MNRNLLLLQVIFLMALGGGCKTTLEEGGAYEGDAILYNADRTITRSYDILHSFVKWEYENRAVLPEEVTRAADSIRANAQNWTQSAVNLREAYATNPNKENQSALENSLNVLQLVLNEAILYMGERRDPVEQ